MADSGDFGNYLVFPLSRDVYQTSPAPAWPTTSKDMDVRSQETVSRAFLRSFPLMQRAKSPGSRVLVKHIQSSGIDPQPHIKPGDAAICLLFQPLRGVDRRVMSSRSSSD